jgi:hypothetical protein
LVATLPRSSERDASELGLRIPLGTAWMAVKGWAAPEVWTSLHPALALAKSLMRNDALLRILWGLTLSVQAQGRVAESLQWAQEMLDIAKATGDADLLITGHTLACPCYWWLPESHICGTKCPAFDDAIKSGEAPGDGLRAGWFISA